ncbi:hypothetical protein M7I_7917 [Glarea lozoyensis 74030]|uniref:2EXR domain-containing protein n=1 Tax=Glarea lozoyensis (strain ATCC 74030 / MF5533) TaxID=1104152 RepID=H0EYL1_GLAL7|nr:hypothetical protein M7I_7917 [Glarea lozoyensis 74030]
MGNPFKRPSKELVRPAPVASTQDTRSMNRTLGPTRIGKKTGERHGPLTKFEVFGRLPPEIRVKIWKEACHAPRAVEIMRREEDSEGSKFPHRNLPPAVLEVNREARNEGLRLYNTFFSSAVYPAYKSYINWNVDYLFLQKEPNEDCQAELIPARGYFDHMAVKKCPRIAILASDTFWFLTWFLDAKDERGNAPEELVEFRQRLQTLMIIENGNPAYYKGEGIKYMGLRDQGDIDETDSRNVVSDFHLLRTLSFEEIVELVPNLVDNIRKHLSNVEASKTYLSLPPAYNNLRDNLQRLSNLNLKPQEPAVLTEERNRCYLRTPVSHTKTAMVTMDAGLRVLTSSTEERKSGTGTTH